MNIQPGDWVVVVNNILKEYGLITQIRGEIKDEKAIILIDEKPYLVQLNWIQRIQDYFKSGDKIEIISRCDVKAKGIITIIDSQSLGINFGEGLRKASNWPFEVCKSIRNLTKEGKMSKEKPTHLTAKDLLEKDACDPGFQKFVARFGKSIYLKDNALKKWFEQNPYKSWLENNLPDHYAVIFDSWQPKINEIVWLDGHPNSIGRIWEKEPIYGNINVIDANGQINTFKVQDLKPISERDFQVGDWVEREIQYNNTTTIIQLDTDDKVRYANAKKEWHKLIISPAIPEVK